MIKKFTALLSILSIFMFFGPAPAFAASISFDTSNKAVSAGSTNATTVALTLASGDTMLVAAACDDTQGTITATWNGTSMTEITHNLNVAGGRSFYLFYIPSPTSGAHNLVFTRSNTSTSAMGGIGQAYAGTAVTAVPSDAHDGITTATVQNISSTFSTTVANSWGLMFVCRGATGTLSSSGNATLRQAANFDGGDVLGGGDSNANWAAGSNTITINASVSTAVGYYAFNLTPGAGSAFKFWQFFGF